MNLTDRARLLRLYPVLRELPATLLPKVEETVMPVQARAGQRLFGDGSPCTHYPLLVEGTIHVSKSSPGGHEILLYHVDPGQSCVVTVLALLGDRSYPALGKAETKVAFFGLPRSVFLAMVLESPAFRVFVFNSIAERMAHLMTLVDDVAFRRIDTRLASRLLLDRQPITATHQMLADELGTSREVVSRTLEVFQEAGMLRLGRRRIEILNRKALDRFRRGDQA